MKMIFHRLAAVVSFVLAGASFAASPSPGFQFDIPAGGLKESMEKFAATVGGDVVFDAFAARDVHTQPVRGQMSPESALNQMLSGTSLYYRYDAGSRRVVISSRKN
ncbi:MAG TPA: STN domain-containing protein [Burkholderiales bacterium]|nr:STN domain-containing protein [Burkholderiales bacterium]